MAIYELLPESIRRVEPTSLGALGVKERGDLQRVLREAIEVVAPDSLVLAEEFSDWEDSRRRIDLLCLDTDANVVVVELKRTDDGGHMELQALRYAAMVSQMTFDRAVDIYRSQHARSTKSAADPQTEILKFLGWAEPRPEEFGRQVRVVLVAAEFSKEITATVLWLNEQGLDVRCVRLGPHLMPDGRILLDVQQVIPLPEAADYQVQLRAKSAEVREAMRESGPWTGWWFVNVGEDREGKSSRDWDDCRRYGFMSAGGNERWVDQIRQLGTGARIFAYVVGHGYVGAGTVTGEPVLRRDFVVESEGKRLLDLPLSITPPAELQDPAKAEWCVPVRWDKTVPREDAFAAAARRHAVCRLRDYDLVGSLCDRFGVKSGGMRSSR